MGRVTFSLAPPFLLAAPQTPELFVRSTQEIFFALGGRRVVGISRLALAAPRIPLQRSPATLFSIRSVYTGLILFSVYGRVKRPEEFKK